MQPNCGWFVGFGKKPGLGGSISLANGEAGLLSARTDETWGAGYAVQLACLLLELDVVLVALR
jgi:hypothetical protein